MDAPNGKSENNERYIIQNIFILSSRWMTQQLLDMLIEVFNEMQKSFTFHLLLTVIVLAIIISYYHYLPSKYLTEWSVNLK